MAIACPDCGTLLSFPALPRRSTAVCGRCHNPIATTIGRSLDAALACSLGTLLLLLPADVLPLLSAEVFGRRSRASLIDGIAQLWAHEWILLAGLSAIFVMLVPTVRLALLSAVLGALRLDWRPRWLGRAFRWAIWLDRWAMVDVFLVAVAAGYYYLNNIERIAVTIQVGGAFLTAAGLLTMLSRATLDEQTVWRAIGADVISEPGEAAAGCAACGLIQPLTRAGTPCLRCGLRVRLRKQHAAGRTAALATAALILLIPANLYPMNVSSLLGAHETYTNFGYVLQLWNLGLWPLSVLVFWTSIVSPAVLLLSLGWCVASVWRGSDRQLVLKTRLARLVTEAGRWSDTSPLSIVFFVSLVDFGSLGAESAGWGATAFILMSLLTIAATVTFDPRQLWDSASRTGIAEETGHS